MLQVETIETLTRASVCRDSDFHRGGDGSITGMPRGLRSSSTLLPFLSESPLQTDNFLMSWDGGLNKYSLERDHFVAMKNCRCHETVRNTVCVVMKKDCLCIHEKDCWYSHKKDCVVMRET